MTMPFKASRRPHQADRIAALYDRSKQFLADAAAAGLDERIAELKAERAQLEQITGAAKTIEDAQAVGERLVETATKRAADIEAGAAKAEQEIERAKREASTIIEAARADADNIAKQAEAQRQDVLRQAAAAQERLDQLKADAEALSEECAKLEHRAGTAEHALKAFNQALADAKRQAAEALGVG